MKDLIIPVLIREVKIWQYMLFFLKKKRLAKFSLFFFWLIFFFLNKSALLFIDVYVYIAVLWSWLGNNQEPGASALESCSPTAVKPAATGKKKKKSKLQARLEIQVVCTARIGQLLYFLKACEKTKLQKCVSEDEQVSCLLLLFKGSKFPPEAIQYARGIAWLADFLLPPRW